MEEITYTTQRLDHLGIVAGICQKIDLIKEIDRIVGPTDRKVSVGQATQAMILNALGFVGRALYLTPEFFENKDVMALVQKVEVRRDKAFSALYGEGGFGNRVIVQIEDGSELKGEAIYPKGHPKNPHSDDELMTKFRNQCAALSSSKQQKLFEALWSLEKLSDCDRLFDLMERDR